MDADQRRLALRTISNDVVALHREHFGRGSNSVRTIMQGDYVATFLEDVFTPAEHTLIRGGHFDQVRHTRQLFQDTLAPEFKKAVENATGRTVIGFFSQVQRDPDMALEAFVLEPLRGGHVEKE